MKLWRYGQSVEYLGRRYRLDGMLGSGGMADVCLAWDEREQREVALKILKSDDLDQETLNRFMKEAAQIAHWQHPHILHVYESLQIELIDAASGSVLFYMVSEYARGGDLQKRLTPGRPFPLSASFALFHQLCDAVQYAHERGVIHRDLKPLNMLFRRPESGPEELVLSDFGLAVQVDASHHTFAHGGTLAYMAPEQFQGHALPASDIFALGVILYLLCTGGLPFRRSLQDMPRVVQGQAPVPTRPSLLNPELPPALDDVLLRAMRDLPAERYRQPREFWEAIELVLTTSAQTFPFVERFWQNAGQTRPYDGSEQPQRSRLSGQQRQPPVAPVSLPGEEVPEMEEGSVSALWIAREKQKASPVRLPLPDDSILTPPNPADAAALEQTPPAGAAAATWRPANAGQAARPAASASGSTILPAPQRSGRDQEQTSRRQPFSDESEYQTSRRQPGESFDNESERQGSQQRASRQLPGQGHQPSASAPNWQRSRRRVSEYDSSAASTSSAYGVYGTYEDEEYSDSCAVPQRRSASGRQHQPAQSSARPAPRVQSAAARQARGTSLPTRLFAGRPRGKRRGPLVAILCGLALLGLLLALFAATSFQGNILTFLGAPITRVTIQPRSQLVQETATRTIRTDSGQIAPGEIPGRQLTATSPTQSATATATGSIQGKRATGQLTFINNGSTPVTLQSTVVTGNSGIPISFDGPITIPALNPSFLVVTGFAVNPGTNGNIPQFDIVKNCCGTNIVVKNSTAFTGGQDALKNGVVQQKDIDGAARGLVTSGQAQAQAALRAQVRTNERMVGNAQCQPQINADQKAGSLAKQVMVQVAVTCSATVYDDEAARQSFARDLQGMASANPALGASYALYGPVVLALVNTPAAGAALQFHAQGLWLYQFTDALQRDLATRIAGKSQESALALLLHQPGILSVHFSASGSLPVNTSEIQFIIQSPAQVSA